MRVHKTHVIPTTIHKRIHRIRIPLRLPTTTRARRIHPLLHRRQRTSALPLDIHALWQPHGQVLLLHRHHPTGVTMHHRDRRPPVPLPAHQPIPQPPLRLLIRPLLPQALHNLLLRLRRRQSRKLTAGVTQHAVRRKHLRGSSTSGHRCRREDNGLDPLPQTVLRPERRIADIVAGHTHDRALAIPIKHILCRKHWQRRRLREERVRCRYAREAEPVLVFFSVRGGGLAFLGGLYKLRQRRVGPGEALDEWV